MKSTNEAIIGGVTFVIALASALIGKRIRRACWQDGVWVAVGDGVKDNPAAKFWNPHTRRHAEENGGKADVLPYLLAKLPDGSIQMGWAPDQGDILGKDWEVLANPTTEIAPSRNNGLPSVSGQDSVTDTCGPKTTGLNFGEALEAMRAGKKVAQPATPPWITFRDGRLVDQDGDNCVVESIGLLATDWQIVSE